MPIEYCGQYEEVQTMPQVSPFPVKMRSIVQALISMLYCGIFTVQWFTTALSSTTTRKTRGSLPDQSSTRVCSLASQEQLYLCPMGTSGPSHDSTTSGRDSRSLPLLNLPHCRACRAKSKGWEKNVRYSMIE